MSEMSQRTAEDVRAGLGLPQGAGHWDAADGVGGNGKRSGPLHREPPPPNPEVSARPVRRRFSPAYKARIVEAAEGCTEPGAIGALLRREGLYSSHLSKWRAQYRQGALDALRDDKRGRKAVHHPLEDENERLRRQNARLQRRLEQAETIIEIQKKVAGMLGIPLTSVEPGEGD